jgi:hypothetical protein
VAIHYRFTDSAGRVHTRTSRREITPQYTHAVVASRGGSCEASFHRGLTNASNCAARWQRNEWNAEICTVEASTRPFPKDRGTPDNPVFGKPFVDPNEDPTPIEERDCMHLFVLQPSGEGSVCVHCGAGDA